MSVLPSEVRPYYYRSSGGAEIDLVLEFGINQFIPNKVILLRPGGEEWPEIANIAKFIKGQRILNGKATAYVCKNYICDLPTNDVKKMLALHNVNKQ